MTTIEVHYEEWYPVLEVNRELLGVYESVEVPEEVIVRYEEAAKAFAVATDELARHTLNDVPLWAKDVIRGD